MAVRVGVVKGRPVECAWGCDAVDTLQLEYQEMGVQFYICTCCSKGTRVADGESYRSGERKADVSGTLIEGFDY